MRGSTRPSVWKVQVVLSAIREHTQGERFDVSNQARIEIKPCQGELSSYIAGVVKMSPVDVGGCIRELQYVGMLDPTSKLSGRIRWVDVNGNFAYRS